MKIFILGCIVCLATLFTGSISPQLAAPPDVIVVKDKSRDRGWLGVFTQDMTSRLARSINSKTTKGALVNDVVDDSPAEKAGIRNEDIIVEFQGITINDASDLSDAVRATKPETAANLVVVRGDERMSLEVTLGAIPRRRAVAVAPPIPPAMHMLERSGVKGLELRELNEQLGAYFQAPNKRGVLVEEVEEESAAEKAGFKAGDVITKIGKDVIEDVRDIRRALNNYDNDEKVDVEILRKGGSMKLTMDVGDLNSPRGYQYYFRGDLHERLDDWDDFGFEMEELDPLLEELRLELDHLRDDLRFEMEDLHHSFRESLSKTSGGTRQLSIHC